MYQKMLLDRSFGTAVYVETLFTVRHR